ncbi:hypothetical protein RND71_016685 [Anisodus tanguticus]|uniref:Uncharacterized protein n=1 Tax=Anisodus tanguticus TaxID=243964 RepID=A0AAE1S9C7_9SOLA|nr:hypothetical protein RND71_016685 [Anisodus tanguticus]
MFLRHNFRQGNRVAHVLATSSLTDSSSSLCHCFAIPPYYVLSLLDQDLSSSVLATKLVDANNNSVNEAFRVHTKSKKGRTSRDMYVYPNSVVDEAVVAGTIRGNSDETIDGAVRGVDGAVGDVAASQWGTQLNRGRSTQGDKQ